MAAQNPTRLLPYLILISETDQQIREFLRDDVKCFRDKISDLLESNYDCADIFCDYAEGFQDDGWRDGDQAAEITSYRSKKLKREAQRV